MLYYVHDEKVAQERLVLLSVSKAGKKKNYIFRQCMYIVYIFMFEIYSTGMVY
jgi:hypothetical protein